MTNKLFVGGLSYGVTDSQLEEHFSQTGKVLSAKVIVDRYTGQGKGFGFVEMATEEEAKTAMDKLNGTQLGDRTIVVKEAKPQEDRSRNFG
ncbi:MAG: RNA-binding protein [Patescibacteria group bacterium]